MVPTSLTVPPGWPKWPSSSHSKKRRGLLFSIHLSYLRLFKGKTGQLLQNLKAKQHHQIPGKKCRRAKQRKENDTVLPSERVPADRSPPSVFIGSPAGNKCEPMSEPVFVTSQSPGSVTLGWHLFVPRHLQCRRAVWCLGCQGQRQEHLVVEAADSNADPSSGL